MAVIGPATGNYSRDSISAARKSQKNKPNPERLIDDPTATGGHRATYDPVTLSQRYGSDYQAEINRRTGIDPGDPTIAVLKDLREQKLTGQPTGLNYDTSGYSSGSGTSSANSAYQDALDALRRQEEIEKEAARKRTQATIDSINSNVPTINQDYENQQVQNYITHTKNMFGLGDFLRAQGLSGGMTESKAGELTANYETSRNTADQAKNNALQNIQNLIAQAQATGDQELATIASSATKAYQELLAQQAAAELQSDLAAQAQAIDNQRYAAEQATNQQRYNDSLTQQAFENDLATKEYNLALQAAQKAKTSGSSGGSPGSKLTASTINNMLRSGLIDVDQAAQMYASIGINIPGANDNTNAVDYAKVTKIINGLGNYMNGQGTNQDAVTYVQGLLDKGSITQAEYNYILKQFGYNM